MENLQDLYTTYLLSSTSQVTATGLSKVLDGLISHDAVTRFLRDSNFNSESIWQAAKPIVREIESSTGVLIVDDSIEEKPYTDESKLICWHWDHCLKRNVKGINYVSVVYDNVGVSVPVGFELVHKDSWTQAKKGGKQKRVSSRGKNEMFRDMVRECANKIKFGHVLADTWYASSENMRMIVEELVSHFIFAIKSNRLVALSLNDQRKGKYVNINELELEQGAVMSVYLKGLDFPVLLCKQVFKNGDGSTGTLYLVSSDLSLDYEGITTIYKRRWKVEEMNKSIKSNASFSKSPTKTIVTQSNHFYASVLAVIKLQMISFRLDKNHFALKEQIYIHGLKEAWELVEELSTCRKKNAA